MKLEEEFEILRQNGWRFQRRDDYRHDGDEWYEIEQSPQGANYVISLAALRSWGWQYHSRFLSDLPEWTQDDPDESRTQVLTIVCATTCVTQNSPRISNGL